MFRFVLNSAVILILGLVQLSNAVFISGVKPNLVLSFIIVASFFSRDWLEKIILVLLGALTLKFHAGFSWNDILFVVSAFTGVLLIKYLKYQTVISILIAVPIATTLMNIYNLNSSIIMEILLNLAAAPLFYITLKAIYVKK